MEICLLLSSRLFIAWLICQHLGWKRHVPPNHLLTVNRLHGITSQKITSLISLSSCKELSMAQFSHKNIRTWTAISALNLVPCILYSSAVKFYAWFRSYFKLIKRKLRGLSPRVNYTDRTNDRLLSAKLVPTLRIEGATWSAWRIPTAVFTNF
jgi:hypothetical protein